MWKTKKKNSNAIFEDFVVDDGSKSARKPIENHLSRKIKDLRYVNQMLRMKMSNEPLIDDESEIRSYFTGLDIIDTSKNPKRLKAAKREVDESGVTYHMDLWFLVSSYITPEDILTFALLCKSSYLVTQSYSFWMGLYNRYYKSGLELPLRLQPQCIKRPNYLKASVIRSLYYMYPPLSKPIPTRQSPDYDKILKFVCVSMWHTKVNKQWYCYFKFQSPKVRSMPNLTNDKRRRECSHWDSYEYGNPEKLLVDVNRNPDEGCKILTVLTSEFVAMPIVMGGHLIDIESCLSREMKKNQLVLTFTFTNYVKASMKNQAVVPRSCGGTGEIIQFYTVDSVTLFDWWHPQYPIGNTFEGFSLQ